MSGGTAVLRPVSASTNCEEKCICELCECGDHHCPHDSSFQLGGGVEFGNSEYGKSFTGKKSEVRELIRPHSNHLAHTGELDMGTTNQADFKQWPNQLVKASRPEEIYAKPESTFNATTTHRTDFTQKEYSAQQPVKPHSASYTRPDQPFTGISTHQADFNEKIVKPSTPFRPPSVLFPKQHAAFTEQSVHRQDYTVFPTSLQRSYKPKESRHISDLPFQASTEHRSNFYTKTLEASHSYKPEPAVYRPSSQPLDATTTYRNGFTHKKDVEIVKPIRQEPALFIHSGAFDADTVHRSDFKGVVNKICPAELVLTRRDRSYKLQGQRNGHRYYRKVVASVPDQVRLRRMSPVQG